MIPARTHHAFVLTPPGAGAIGVVRVIGPDAVKLVAQLFRPRGGREKSERASVACHDALSYGQFISDNEVVDDVVVSRAPVGAVPAVDVCAHGGIRVIERILEALERHGARLGEAREAFASLWPADNLIMAEAADAMSRAKTARAVQFLAWQRTHLAGQLEHVAALCRSNAHAARKPLQTMLDAFDTAQTLIEGATVAIIGPANCGKSTLFNELVGRSATIVSPAAGTTRDWVCESVEMQGVPVTLVDTAGRRESPEAIERQAVLSGQKVSELARACILLLSGSEPLSGADRDLSAACASWPHCLTVINKVDLESVWDEASLPSRSAHGIDPLRVSAVTGVGLERLIGNILFVLGFRGWVDRAPALFTARQREVTLNVLGLLSSRPVEAASEIREQLIQFPR